MEFTLFGDLNPSWELTSNEIVRRRLFVYVFENAPLASKAREHVEAATLIWRGVGIDFKPSYRFIDGELVREILGEDKVLKTKFGSSDMHEGEWQERKRVQELKPHLDSFAIIFAPTTAGTRADPDRSQAYIQYEPYSAPIGRTVAHEIGHLLLGGGHTGSPTAKWTSGLMRDGNLSNAVGISEKDAELARQRATRIPH